MAKLAFLGAGNMAAAMVDGLIANGVSPASLSCLGGGGNSADALAARTGISKSDSLERLLKGADAVVIAFKPQHLASADPSLAELTSGGLVISVLAGKKLDRLSRTFPRARNIVRCMPNTPSRIGAGMTGWCPLKEPTEEDLALVETLLGAMGESVRIAENQMDALTAVSGSGPAYVFEFAGALRDAGIAAGLESSVAEELVIQTLLGSARLLAGSEISPEKLRDQVTSPNGTTFAGLKKLSEGDLRGLVRSAVQAARARSEELSRD